MEMEATTSVPKWAPHPHPHPLSLRALKLQYGIGPSLAVVVSTVRMESHKFAELEGEVFLTFGSNTYMYF